MHARTRAHAHAHAHARACARAHTHTHIQVIEDNGKHEVRGRKVDVKSAVRREDMAPQRGAAPEEDAPVKKVIYISLYM